MVFRIIEKKDVKGVLAIVNKALIHYQSKEFKDAKDSMADASNAFLRIETGLAHQVGPNAVDRASKHMRSSITYLAKNNNMYGLGEIEETIRALNSIIVDLKN